MTDAATPDLTGWDARLTELAAGLDLTADPGLRTLALRLIDHADMPTLRALARWLGAEPARRAARYAELSHAVAVGWAAEQAKRATTAARAAAGTSPFSRLPSTDDEGAF